MLGWHLQNWVTYENMRRPNTNVAIDIIRFLG